MSATGIVKHGSLHCHGVVTQSVHGHLVITHLIIHAVQNRLNTGKLSVQHLAEDHIKLIIAFRRKGGLARPGCEQFRLLHERKQQALRPSFSLRPSCAVLDCGGCQGLQLLHDARCVSYFSYLFVLFYIRYILQYPIS